MDRATFILDFWLGPGLERNQPAIEIRQRWFMQDAAWDLKIADDFGTDIDKAARGALDDWLMSMDAGQSLSYILKLGKGSQGEVALYNNMLRGAPQYGANTVTHARLHVLWTVEPTTLKNLLRRAVAGSQLRSLLDHFDIYDTDVIPTCPATHSDAYVRWCSIIQRRVLLRLAGSEVTYKLNQEAAEMYAQFCNSIYDVRFDRELAGSRPTCDGFFVVAGNHGIPVWFSTRIAYGSI